MAYKLDDIRHLHVYAYHFLDDLRFVHAPEEVLDDADRDEFARLLEAVRDRFLSAGWEGDGKLGIIWLPPFIDAGVEDTWGTYVWHVKQDNNGTSWLASKFPLDFARLRSQTEENLWETHVPVSIVYSDCLNLKRGAEQIVRDVGRRLKVLESISDAAVEEIRAELLLSAQGEVVAKLQEFLDDSYLQVLMHVLKDGNPSQLQVAKCRAGLNPASYLPATEEESNATEGGDASMWFTIMGLIHDIWRSYKFEPFKEKSRMLYRAFEYSLSDETRQMLTKHVVLRNCIQHHERQVTADALKDAGVREFEIANDAGDNTKLGPWKSIFFSAAELEKFSRCLDRLADEFEKHVSKRVRSVVWVPKSRSLGSRLKDLTRSAEKE
jgi:hypothetical protein